MREFMTFDAAEPALVARRRIARALCSSISNNPDGREPLYKLLFGSVGEGFEQWGNFFCEFGSNINIGDGVFINANGVFLDAFEINIGNRVFIGPHVGIYTSNHAKDLEQRRRYIESGAPVVIEDDVWIGGGATVLPGVTVGKGSIIGAGAVVAKSVPPHSKVLGAGSQVYPI